MPGVTVNAVHPLRLRLVSSMRRQQRHKVGRAKNSRNLSFKSKKEYVQVVRVPSTSLRSA